MLKPQDVVVMLKLHAIGRREWSYNSLAVELGMSPSQVLYACQRAVSAKLGIKQHDKVVPLVRNLKDFIIHGLPYVFYPVRGELTRGMPTIHGAEPLASIIVADNEPVPVWPDPKGSVRGMTLEPIFKSAPEAARNDKKLYELLVLVDAIRAGNAREKKIAMDLLEKEFNYEKGAKPEY